MKIIIEEAGVKGDILIAETIKGSGTIDQLSWCLSSTSSTLIFEISENPEIQPQDLPLVGYGTGGWIIEQPITFDKNEVESLVKNAFLLFKGNKLNYVPAVTSPCRDY